MEKSKERMMTVEFHEKPSQMQQRMERYVSCLQNAAVTKAKEKDHD